MPEVLANMTMVICNNMNVWGQYVVHQNLHDVIYQLYLSKKWGKYFYGGVGGFMGFSGGSAGKESACQCRRCGVWSLGWEDPLEKRMATHSNILPGEIPWTEEPGGLQSMGSQRVRRDWVTHTHTHTDGVIIFSCHSPVPFLLYLYSRVYPWRNNGLKVVLLHTEFRKCHWKPQEVIQIENVNAFKAELMFNKMGCWANTRMLRLKASLLPF